MNTEPGEREETPRPIGWQTAQIAFDNPRMVKVVFETPECAKAFIDSIEPADGPVVAATRMRERCVEQIKEVREGYKSLNATLALDDAVTAVESLTLNTEKEADDGEKSGRIA